MAEAIAALAFAGNIVQFLEFGAKFIDRADKIAKSGSNSLSDLKDLRHITHYFHPILQQLMVDGSSDQVSSTSTSQSRIVKLSKECSHVVRELLQTLDDIGVNDNGRRMDAIITSFRLMWNHSKIDQLHAAIEKLRNQLAVELLVSIREHSTKSVETQEAILQHLKADSRYKAPETKRKQARGPADDLDNAPGNIMLEYISSTLISDTARDQMKKTEKEVHYLLFGKGDYTDYGNIFGQNHPKVEMKEARRENIESRIISTLRYAEIDDRETTIAEAYAKTLQWIFEEKPDNRKDTKFREWLESSDRLYWVTGKAGSGKSTLMKYISNFDGISEGSTRCEEHLRKWAGGKDRLVVASFYFWASGSVMEASQRGLFQSLLFQVLTAYPDLISLLVPKTWEAWSFFNLETDISTEREHDKIFLGAIRELVERRGKKVCLFVDGLDEYKGDHHKLITVFKSFLLLPNVKICVSSRPWIVFEDNFNKSPSLMLQDFTYPDIEHFVTSQFSENEGFTRLQLRDPQYAGTLMKNITDKSSGVFLWIKLVVKSLLAGLTFDDRISDLQRRLNLLPPDLETLYVAILEDLDPFYFGHASQYFQLLQASNDSPDALLYSFTDEESLDFVLKLPIRAFTEEEKKHRTDTVKRRLNSRCKGLLEVGPQGKVQYLHRSVKDYIDGSEVRLRIEKAVETDFDCHFQLCSANLAMVKTMHEGQAFDQERISHAKECLIMAAKVKQNISGMIQILDDLDKTMRATLPSRSLNSFYRAVPNVNSINPWLETYLGTSFLATTVRFSVVDYVRARTEANCLAPDDDRDHDDISPFPLNPRSGTPSRFKRLMRRPKFLTPSVANKSTARRMGTWPLLLDANLCDPISLPMFRCLLELGADPNLMFHRNGATPWVETLAAMVMACGTIYSSGNANVSRRWEHWVPILLLFQEYGAVRDNLVCDTVLQSLHRAPRIGLSSERLAIALECVATGREDLGLEYLRGENDVTTFKWENRKSVLSTPRSRSPF